MSSQHILNSKNFLKEKYIHAAFVTALVLKGLHALIEIVGGIGLYFITKDIVVRFVISITQKELLEDPKDFVANFLITSARQLSIGTQHFAAFYLLSHGVVKGILVLALFRKKIWAYPISIVVFCLFIAYQLYRFSYTHSAWLIVFTIFDVIVVLLTVHEYRYFKNNPIRDTNI